MRNVFWCSSLSSSCVVALALVTLGASGCSLKAPERQVHFVIDTATMEKHFLEGSAKGIAASLGTEIVALTDGAPPAPSMNVPTTFFATNSATLGQPADFSNGFSCLAVNVTGTVIPGRALPREMEFHPNYQPKTFSSLIRVVPLKAGEPTISVPLTMPALGRVHVAVWGIQTERGGCPSPDGGDDDSSVGKVEVYSLAQTAVDLQPGSNVAALETPVLSLTEEDRVFVRQEKLVVPIEQGCSGVCVALGPPSEPVVNAARSITLPVAISNATTIYLSEAHLNVNGTGGAQCTAREVSVSGGEATITLSGCSGNGVVSVSIQANAAQRDGLQSPASEIRSFSVDNAPPTLLSVTPATESLTFTFNEGAFDFHRDDISISSSTGAIHEDLGFSSSSDLKAHVLSVRFARPPGIVTFSIPAGAFRDRAMNPNVAITHSLDLGSPSSPMPFLYRSAEPGDTRQQFIQDLPFTGTPTMVLSPELPPLSAATFRLISIQQWLESGTPLDCTADGNTCVEPWSFDSATGTMQLIATQEDFPRLSSVRVEALDAQGVVVGFSELRLATVPTMISSIQTTPGATLQIPLPSLASSGCSQHSWQDDRSAGTVNFGAGGCSITLTTDAGAAGTYTLGIAFTDLALFGGQMTLPTHVMWITIHVMAVPDLGQLCEGLPNCKVLDLSGLVRDSSGQVSAITDDDSLVVQGQIALNDNHTLSTLKLMDGALVIFGNTSTVYLQNLILNPRSNLEVHGTLKVSDGSIVLADLASLWLAASDMDQGTGQLIPRLVAHQSSVLSSSASYRTGIRGPGLMLISGSGWDPSLQLRGNLSERVKIQGASVTLAGDTRVQFTESPIPSPNLSCPGDPQLLQFEASSAYLDLLVYRLVAPGSIKIHQGSSLVMATSSSQFHAVGQIFRGLSSTEDGSCLVLDGQSQELTAGKLDIATTSVVLSNSGANIVSESHETAFFWPVRTIHRFQTSDQTSPFFQSASFVPGTAAASFEYLPVFNGAANLYLLLATTTATNPEYNANPNSLIFSAAAPTNSNRIGPLCSAMDGLWSPAEFLCSGPLRTEVAQCQAQSGKVWQGDSFGGFCEEDAANSALCGDVDGDGYDDCTGEPMAAS